MEICLIDSLLSFILWLSVVFLIVRLGKLRKDEVKEVGMNYSLNGISDDEMELLELVVEQDAQDVLDILPLEETYAE